MSTEMSVEKGGRRRFASLHLPLDGAAGGTVGAHAGGLAGGPVGGSGGHR